MINIKHQKCRAISVGDIRGDRFQRFQHVSTALPDPSADLTMMWAMQMTHPVWMIGNPQNKLKAIHNFLIWRFPVMGVPPSSILVGFSIVNQSFWGPPMAMESPI